MTEPRKSRWSFWAAWMLFAAFPLYPVSFGPACWLYARGQLSQRTLSRIYAPMVWVGNEGPEPFDDLVLWYADLVIRNIIGEEK